MARYIDCDKCYHGRVCAYRHHYHDMITDCNHHKFTTDVEEVKHGEWELKSEIHRYLEEIDEEFYVECPFCNRVYYVPFEFEDKKMLEYAKKNYPYCNCGAKMDGKENDNG